MEYTSDEMENMRLSVAITDWNLDEIESGEINPQLFVNASNYIDARLQQCIQTEEAFDVETCLEEMQFSKEEVTVSLGWLVALIGNVVEKDRANELMTEEERINEQLLWAAWKNVVEENIKKQRHKYPPLAEN